MDPTVLPILCSILNPKTPGQACTLASVASWADQIKDKMTWSKPIHYVNAIDDYPPSPCLFPGPKGWEGDKNVNVLGGIRNTTDLLTQWVEDGSKPKDSVAAEALKFMVHFVGDMQMPFHLVARGHGANDYWVKWGNDKVREYPRPHLSSAEKTSETEPLR